MEGDEMTLADYLASEAAREDVKALLERRRLTPNFADIHAKNPHRFMGITKTGAWHVVTMSVEGETCQALYRPDGDRYVVTDLGEGVRALRLRTGESAYGPATGVAMLEKLKLYDAQNPRNALGGMAHELELIGVTAADLPDAICRVMLASLRVAQS
jgi:hypothetical protein